MRETGVYRQLVELPYLTAYRKTLEASIRLDVFTRLTKWMSAEELAEQEGWDAANTKTLLDALHSIGFLDRDGDDYRDTDESAHYLSADSRYYMGAVVLFFASNPGLDPGDVEEQVRRGASAPEPMEQTMDFAAYGDSMRLAQSDIRIQEILDLLDTLPEYESCRRFLDLGCGAGMIGLGILQDGPDRYMSFFDVPPMKGLIGESISRADESARCTVMTGDFMCDPIGEGYDLILASGVLFFAMADLPGFMRKLYDALVPGGVAVCINEGIAPDASGPWEMILGYLPMKLQGMPVGVPAGAAALAAREAGFEAEVRTELLSTGTQEISILRRPGI